MTCSSVQQQEQRRVRLGDLCPAPCFPDAARFELPATAHNRDALRFATEGDRHFYALPLSNHRPSRRASLNPRAAIVGLSPAGNQINGFISAIRSQGGYESALVQATFAGLAPDIIAMLRGLGLTRALGIEFPNSSLADHPDVFVTSLVACATLSASGGSDAFDPRRYRAAGRCITDRFLPELSTRALSASGASSCLAMTGGKP